ncbi:DUF5658 family protein [Bacillus sp. SCS-153A]|uniref:DUF5658 family protein n=1 Tax=Rossellomorea sedimentorum TaxID=3115294 RepID=UPI003906AA8A
MMRLALHLLAVLNIIDGIITLVGLKGNFIEEANPLMAALYQAHPILFILVKLSFSALLYAFIRNENFPSKKWLLSLTYTAITLYTFTILLHGTWISLILFR